MTGPTYLEVKPGALLDELKVAPHWNMRTKASLVILIVYYEEPELDSIFAVDWYGMPPAEYLEFMDDLYVAVNTKEIKEVRWVHGRAG
jgi:hypothetical protein